ncbi:hypothetical protein [Pseudomonas aeruginosa]|uniref:hypothetical protein n=2 Tax=Pseudomonas aeruginosa TaxID=287 RepID=UPI00287FE26B|nr:hypothetical protein [Pseudomonas aeruginosa]
MASKRTAAAVDKLKNLDQRQLSIALIALFLLLALGVYSLGAPLKQRLSQLPVKGQVTSQVATVDLPANPMAIPAAVAVPPAGVSVAETNLEDVDQIFLPADKPEPEGKKEEDLREKAEQAIRAALGRVTLDAVANRGAFLSGEYISVGQRLGFSVSDSNGKELPVVLSSISRSQVVISAGPFSHVLKMRQE